MIISKTDFYDLYYILQKKITLVALKLLKTLEIITVLITLFVSTAFNECLFPSHQRIKSYLKLTIMIFN